MPEAHLVLYWFAVVAVTLSIALSVFFFFKDALATLFGPAYRRQYLVVSDNRYQYTFGEDQPGFYIGNSSGYLTVKWGWFALMAYLLIDYSCIDTLVLPSCCAVWVASLPLGLQVTIWCYLGVI